MVATHLKAVTLGLVLLALSFALSLTAGLTVLRNGEVMEYTVQAPRGYSIHPLPDIRGSHVVLEVPGGVEAYLPDERRLDEWLRTGRPFDDTVPREGSLVYLPSVSSLVLFNPGSDREVVVRLRGVEVEKPYLGLAVPAAVSGVIGLALVLPSLTLLVAERRRPR